MFLIFFMLICQRWYFMSKKFVYLMFYVSLKYPFVILIFFLKFFCDYFGIDFCMLVYYVGSTLKFKIEPNHWIHSLIHQYTLTLYQPYQNKFTCKKLFFTLTIPDNQVFSAANKNTRHCSLVVFFFVSFFVLK